MKKFWDLRNSAEGAKLYIYGDIEATQFWGDELTPDIIRQQLDACSGPMEMHINSPGGDVFAGMAIYNLLKRYEDDITVYIDGLAASIASVIAMAGDKIIMPENALMMIHDAWCMTAGNAADLRKMADELDRVDNLIRDVYAARSGQDPVAFEGMMAAETWFTAAEAEAAGLIDEVEQNKAIAAQLIGSIVNIGGQVIPLDRFAHAEALRDMAEAQADPADGTHEPDNGEETQPVEDKDALADQRRQFDALRRKIIETTN